MARLVLLFSILFSGSFLAGCDGPGAVPPTAEATVSAVTLDLGNWQQLEHAAPEAIASVLLLSDGSVMGQGPWVSKHWYKLTPGPGGGYVDATWSPLASMSTERLYYASGVLADGRVYVQGGEYSGPDGGWNMVGTGEIYDPVADSWSPMAPFPKGAYGDDPSEILPDGRILAGFFGSASTYLYDPSSNSWSAAPDKLAGDRSDEETWVKLPDDSILSYDIFGAASGHPREAQRYVPSLNQWISAGVSPVQLENDIEELGPALLLPSNGKVFYVGATSHTAIYTPPATLTGTGSWEVGPMIPNGYGANDAPAAVLPNGHVIFAAGPSADFSPPTVLMDYDPTSSKIVIVKTPEAMGLSQVAPYVLRMLVLPTCQLMVTTDFDSKPWIFTPASGVASGTWAPTVDGVVANGDGTYTLSGIQLNGKDEGSSYGDDFENSTNYPIVRLTSSSGEVQYARTSNWSSTGVATGNAPVSTEFTLPQGISPGSGTYILNVIANGIASEPYTFSP